MRVIRPVLSVLAVLSAASMVDSGATGSQQTSAGRESVPATYITAADIQAKQDHDAHLVKSNGLPNIRVVDAGGYNVAFTVIHREHAASSKVAQHFKVTEIYHILDGSGTLVTGGAMVNPTIRPPDLVSVTKEDGPGASGTSIKGGVTRRVAKGDVVIIPAGTPHWWSEIPGSITYSVVRVDPSRVLPLR